MSSPEKKAHCIKLFKEHFVNSHNYSKAMTKFQSKFQFQTPLQFYRTARKVTKIKLVMVIVKRFSQIPPSVHQRGYNAGIIAWNIKPFSALFFDHFIQPSLPPTAKWKSLFAVLRVSSPHEKCSQFFVDSPPYDDFKISPQPICFSKSHKYDKYNKTTYKVSPFC